MGEATLLKGNRVDMGDMSNEDIHQMSWDDIHELADSTKNVEVL